MDKQLRLSDEPPPVLKPASVINTLRLEDGIFVWGEEIANRFSYEFGQKIEIDLLFISTYEFFSASFRPHPPDPISTNQRHRI